MAPSLKGSLEVSFSSLGALPEGVEVKIKVPLVREKRSVGLCWAQVLSVPILYVPPLDF